MEKHFFLLYPLMRVCMREYARLFWANLPIRTTITNSTRGWPRLGLLTLATAGERASEGRTRRTLLCTCVYV